MAADDTTDATSDAAADADAEPALLSPEASSLLEQMQLALGDSLVAHDGMAGDLVARVSPDAWLHAARVVKDDLECDYLSFVSGIDWMPRPTPAGADDAAGGDISAPVQPTEMTFGSTGSAGRFQVLAHVESTRHHHAITLKTDVDESDPRVQSWVSVYPGADWHERECWEMYGFVFDGHPALRRLYLPAEFEGYPLRKDFPLLAREVKPWPGLVDVEGMPDAAADTTDADSAAEADA